ncbi:MAG: hypothetical protein ACSLEY_01340 [Candidatus Saccharimonadales bacterium]
MKNDFFDVALKLLSERYNLPVHTASAALRMKNDRIISASNIDYFSGFFFEETAALTIAINDGKYEFDEIIAIRNDEAKIAIANLCDKYRQIFYDYAAEIKVVTSDGAMAIHEVIPGVFTRQRDKIMAALRG